MQTNHCMHWQKNTVEFSRNIGENKFVIMLGGLHVEMACMKTMGDWLEGSGWTALLTEANIASFGTADSFLKAAHISHTRYAHEVTACGLYYLMQKAYTKYTEELSESDTALSYDVWKEQRTKEVQCFTISQYLSNTSSHFWALFSQSDKEITVHLSDMLALPDTNPSAMAEFEKGNFVVLKSQNPFSKIALNHAHEQNNRTVKGDGGLIGLTQKSPALLRWMVLGPEVAWVIHEF